MKHIKLFEQFVESLSKGSYSTLKRNDIIKHTDSDIMLRISVVKPNVSGVILNSGAYKGKPIRMGDVIAVKPKEIEEWELSSLDEASSKTQFNTYTIKDFPVGAMVHFNDGETWQVIKSNKSLLKNKIGGDEITIKPISKPGGDLKIKMDFLNANVVKVSESVNEKLNEPFGLQPLMADEESEGYKAEVLVGRFDGRSINAQSTDKVFSDGVPVMKNFTRGGKKPVRLKGDFHLVDSSRGWWYIYGPQKTWYAVKQAEYGTPPFEL